MESLAFQLLADLTVLIKFYINRIITSKLVWPPQDPLPVHYSLSIQPHLNKNWNTLPVI